MAREKWLRCDRVDRPRETVCDEQQITHEVRRLDRGEQRNAVRDQDRRAEESQPERHDARAGGLLVEHEPAEQDHGEGLGADEQRGVCRGRALDAVAAEHERQRVAQHRHREEARTIAPARREDRAQTRSRDRHENDQRDDGPHHDERRLGEAAERDLREHVRRATDEIGDDRDGDVPAPRCPLRGHGRASSPGDVRLTAFEDARSIRRAMPQDPSGWPPRRPQTDPLEDLQKLWGEVRSRLPGGDDSGGGGRRLNPYLVALGVLLAWAATGIYIVAPDERGVVLRFGKVVRETESGPHYRLPWPIEQVLKPSVTSIRKEEIGFRTVETGRPARYQEVDAEALMLTGDENIVKLEFIVQYKVRADADGTSAFLFNIRDPQGTLRAIAEASMREVIGRTDIDDALTEGKEQIQIAAQQELQRILDAYAAGIDVVTVQLQDVDPPNQVSDAFKDVISAQQDKERHINEAYGYANDLVPKARGEAAQLVNEAEGHREGTVCEATGAAQRFLAVQAEYAKAPAVTRRRLYLETMEAILPGVTKIVLDENAARQVVPYLPLDQVLKARPLEAVPQQSQ